MKIAQNGQKLKMIQGLKNNVQFGTWKVFGGRINTWSLRLLDIIWLFLEFKLGL
jgi:hypothetical protein